MVLLLMLSGVVVFTAGYVLYGRFLEGRLGVEPEGTTPAHALRDGLDYVPARPSMLFGHHFSSIAGAGPIVGPVIAAVAFGWLPSVLWILIGAVLIGGVQDLSSLMASIRHRARSVADIARQQISPLAHTLFLIFVWFALVYVIVVFLDLTSATFVDEPGVASSSLMYIVLAVVLGLVLLRTGIGLRNASLVFVPLVFVGIWLGQQLPLNLPFADAGQGWDVILLGYCLVASILPVFLLLQPRDYLSSYLLYACLGGGVLGAVLGGGALPDGVEPLRAVVTLSDANLGLLFPAMFITIACGACSGFHSIVSSGTTAKQVSRETHARPIAYGSMLLEGVLAILAVCTVIIVGAQAAAGQPPTLVFASGMGYLLGKLGLPAALGTSFGALAISTFLLTTLDTSTRLARYVLEELLRLPRGNRWTIVAATVASLAIPAVLTQVTLHLPDGTPAPAWRVIWPVFGATNQLLGALAMLVVTAWLRNQGRRHGFVAAPMLFMFVVTLVALAQLVWRYGVASLIGGIAAALFVLAVILLIEAIRKVFSLPPGQHPVTATTSEAG
jgi:carbon starvation protein